MPSAMNGMRAAYRNSVECSDGHAICMRELQYSRAVHSRLHCVCDENSRQSDHLLKPSDRNTFGRASGKLYFRVDSSCAEADMSDPSIRSPHAAALAITFGGIQLLKGGMNPEKASFHLHMPSTPFSASTHSSHSSCNCTCLNVSWKIAWMTQGVV